MIMDDEAVLFNFSVRLTRAGHVSVEHEYVKPEEFKEAMDKWNSKYENTEVLVALIKFLSNHSMDLEKDIRKVLY